MGVVCPHGLSTWAANSSAKAEDSEVRHWQTSKSMTARDPGLSQKSESKNRPESGSTNWRFKN
jgi:hypothetical protein